IQEIPEAPTPAPEQSAKPRPKRTIKSKATSESSEASTKRQTLLPQPQSQAAPSQNSFDGTRTTDDVRTITVNPDGSRTAYEFDRAHHKATATTTEADGKPGGKIQYELDDAGRFARSRISVPNGQFKFRSVYK